MKILLSLGNPVRVLWQTFFECAMPNSIFSNLVEIIIDIDLA